MEKIKLDSVIETGSRSVKGKTVQEIINGNRRYIFDMIKKYKLNFDDEVLKEAHISKTIRNRKIYQEEINVSRDRDATIKPKKLKKDNKNIDDILDEIIDNYSSNISEKNNKDNQNEVLLES